MLGKQRQREKIRQTLHEFKTGTLHSGSKQGPLVKKRPQAIAIALRQSGQPPKRGK